MEIEEESDIISTSPNLPIKKFSFNRKCSSAQIDIYSRIKSLISKYSLKKVIDRAIHLLKLKDESNLEKCNKRFTKLDSSIYQIYQKEGSIKVFQTLINIEKNKKMNNIEKINGEIFIDLNSNQNSVNDVEEINLNEEDSENSNENKKNKKNKKKVNNNLINNLNDNYKEKEKNESGNKLNSSNYIEINIINKSTKKKKTKIKFDVSKISYHCSIIHGIYYKYKLFNFLTKNEIVFSCENPKCESYGIFDINEKTFTISKPHWDGTSIICYHNQMNEDDIDNYNYMINNNLDEIQIYSDNNK